MPRELGFEVDRRATSCSRSRRRSTRARVRERAGDGPLFLSFDVDVLDPAFAPGTGTPEVGGAAHARGARVRPRAPRAPLRRLRRRRGEPAVRRARAADGRRGRQRRVRAADPRRPRRRREPRSVRIALTRRPHRGRGRLPRVEDRARDDARRPRARPISRGSRSRSAIMIGTVPVLAARWDRLLRAQGIHERLAVADARVLRRLRGRAGAPDLARRRRGAGRRDRPPAPGPRGGASPARSCSSAASAARRPFSSARSRSSSRSAATT